MLTESLWEAVVWCHILQGTWVRSGPKQNKSQIPKVIAVSVIGKVNDVERIELHVEIILVKIHHGPYSK